MSHDQVIQSMEAVVRMCGDGKINPESYEYETFVKQSFQLRGRGCLYVDATNLIYAVLTEKSVTETVTFSYLTPPTSQDISINDLVEQSLLESCKAYNPRSEYVLFQLVDTHALPPQFRCLERYLLAYWLIPFQNSRPTPLSKKQIRKRLNRMAQSGQRLLIADTSHPDFMGQNLEKWLRELKQLQDEGKPLNIIIDSQTESDTFSLPDDLKSDIISVKWP